MEHGDIVQYEENGEREHYVYLFHPKKGCFGLKLIDISGTESWSHVSEFRNGTLRVVGNISDSKSAFEVYKTIRGW